MDSVTLESEARKEGKALGQHIHRLMIDQLGDLALGVTGELPVAGGLYETIRQLQADNQTLKTQVAVLSGEADAIETGTGSSGNVSPGDSAVDASAIIDESVVNPVAHHGAVILSARVIRVD